MQFNRKKFYFLLCCALQIAVNFFMLSRAWDAPPVAAIVPGQILSLIAVGLIMSSQIENHDKVVMVYSGIAILAVAVFTGYHLVYRGYRFWEFPATYRAVPLHVAVGAVYFLSLFTLDLAILVFRRQRSPYLYAQLIILGAYSVYCWRFFL